MSINKFLIDKYDNLRVDIKMYKSEISKFKISDLKPQKMTVLWTLKHVSAISKHPVFRLIHKKYGFFGNRKVEPKPTKRGIISSTTNKRFPLFKKKL